jgi:hypothetical protein
MRSVKDWTKAHEFLDAQLMAKKALAELADIEAAELADFEAEMLKAGEEEQQPSSDVESDVE